MRVINNNAEKVFTSHKYNAAFIQRKSSNFHKMLLLYVHMCFIFHFNTKNKPRCCIIYESYVYFKVLPISLVHMTLNLDLWFLETATPEQQFQPNTNHFGYKVEVWNTILWSYKSEINI